MHLHSPLVTFALLLRCHLLYSNHSHLYSHTPIAMPSGSYMVFSILPMDTLNCWLQGSGIKPPIPRSVNDPPSHGCPDMCKICVSDLATSMPSLSLSACHSSLDKARSVYVQSVFSQMQPVTWKLETNVNPYTTYFLTEDHEGFCQLHT